MRPLLSIQRASIFAQGLDHPECVAVHPNGTIYAGGEAGQIYEITQQGKRVREIASTGGFILGVAVSPDGTWLAACDLENRAVWRLDLISKKFTRFAKGVAGHTFRVPNHLAFAQDGRLFVTDSGSAEQPSGKILCFHANHSGKGRVWHHGPFAFPNGIATAPDGLAIYVVCSLLPGVERIEVRPDGSAGKRTKLVRMPRTVPDGLVLDNRGRLLISCYAPNRIYQLSPHGKLSILIDDWFSHSLSNPTNIAFLNRKHNELLVSNLGRWHLTKIRLQ